MMTKPVAVEIQILDMNFQTIDMDIQATTVKSQVVEVEIKSADVGAQSEYLEPTPWMWSNICNQPDNSIGEFLKIPSWKCTRMGIQPNEWTPIDAASDTINDLSNQIK